MSSVVSTLISPTFTWSEKCLGWWLKKEGPFTVISEQMPPGTSETKHMHESTEQFFYILEGSLFMEYADQCIELQAHQGITILPLVPHRVLNKSNQDARFLVISYPNSHQDRVDLI